jgi:hypothetical protein
MKTKDLNSLRHLIFILSFFHAALFGAEERLAIGFSGESGNLTNITIWNGYEPVIGLNFSQRIDYCTSQKNHIELTLGTVWSLSNINLRCFDRDGVVIHDVPLILSIESLNNNQISIQDDSLVVPASVREPYIRLWIESMYEKSNGIRYTFPIILSFSKAINESENS